MRNFITIISIFIGSSLFGQNLDSLTFNYINQYRVKNNKKVLTWSNDLYVTSVKQSDSMVVNDSIYHSHDYTYSENVIYGKNSGFLVTDGYKIFIKKYYNLSCDDILKDFNVFFATNIVYNWYVSKDHNKIMLLNGSYGAVHIVLNNVIKKNNFIMGHELFKGAGPFYYKVTVSGTFQIK
jgi:uncharacterized protein YkwD